MTHLDGRRALVTGGARGIGAAIVRRLAADGAAVAFTYGTSGADADRLVAEVTASGGSAIALRADAGDPEQVALSIAGTVSQLGGLDILVNNAGVGVFGDVEALSFEDFDRMLAVNVSGVFAAIKFGVPHMGDGGRIINIGSVFADRLAVPGLAVYTMTKGAVSGLTRGLTRELAPRGITINNVQPGPTATDMNPEEGEFAAALKTFIALGRYGQPAEVAGVVSFLAGPEAAYITGANWTVDGGYAA